MLPLFFFFVGLLLSIISTNAIDYEDNDLAKVCRPIDRQLDLLFVLDGSGSVSGSTFATQMQMLNRIVEMVDIGPNKTQIAVMQYSSYTRVEFGFSAHQNKENLKNALSKIRHLSGTTKTGKALDKALHLFRHDAISGARRDQEDVAQVAVVVTDGHSHDDPVPAAQRLRQAGVQILTLGIGAHINMGELFDITGDETLAFQNLTSESSLDQFVNQFKKIAVGELCKFARGAHGAEIICNSDSIDVRVSTVNPFYGHLYVANQFSHPECVAKTSNLSTEIHLPLNLTSCNIQRQSMINPKGAMFETVVVLKFHPSYNTEKDKVFNVQCFYPEKTAKLPQKLANNRVAISDSNHSIKMPCSYKISARTPDPCRLEDTRVGDTVIHSWECDKNVFDTYQSMLVHSCIITDVISGNNQIVVDANGCSTDASVMESPDYSEPLTAFAVGKSVKFPDSSLVQFQCQLRFCDRLLGECDELLPPRCNKKRKSILPEETTTSNADLLRVKKQAGFAVDVKPFDMSDDGEYDEAPETLSSTAIPIVTFSSPLLERKAPPHRRHPAPFGSNSRFRSNTENIQLFPLDSESHHVENVVTGALHQPLTKPLVVNNLKSDGQPRLLQFPNGSLDVKLNTQNVEIISNNHPVQIQNEVNEEKQLSEKSIGKVLPATEQISLLKSEANKQISIDSRGTKQLPDTRKIMEGIVNDSAVIKRTNLEVKIDDQHVPSTVSQIARPKIPDTRREIIAVTASSQQSDALKESQKLTILLKEKVPKGEEINNSGSTVTNFTNNVEDPFQAANEPGNVPMQIHDEKKESNEVEQEFEPVVKLESRIADALRTDAMSVESQVITVRDLEIMQDPYKTHKWCKRT